MLCTKYGLFSLKLNGWFGLYSRNQTDPSNLVWSAFFIARMTAPLSYNFLLFLKIGDSQFSQVMGVIDYVPVLGKEFTTFFPLTLLFFCGLNYFHVYGRFMKMIGLSSFTFDDKSSEEKLSEGKGLILKARCSLETSKLVAVTAVLVKKANSRCLTFDMV